MTGNYAFFNVLAGALCLFMLDDAAWRRVAQAFPGSPKREPREGGRPAIAGLAAFAKASAPRKPCATTAGRLHRVAMIAVAVVTVPVSLLAFTSSLGFELPGWPLIVPIARLIEPLRSVNSYGLFAVMTTTRPEIVLEGSDDGQTWQAYEFRYKTGDVYRRPPWVAPAQPRLDWQMWFAALSRFEDEPWFQSFCLRLLEGSPQVLASLDRDPFHGRPPRYLRGTLYRYRFSDGAARRAEGVWWTRERLGEYSPVMSLTPAAR